MHTLITDITHSIKQYTNVRTKTVRYEIALLSISPRGSRVIHIAALDCHRCLNVNNHEQDDKN